MEDISERIRRFLNAVEEACTVIARQTPVDVNSRDVELALVEVCGLDESLDLLNEEWTPATIVARLGDYNFRRLRPEVFDRIELEESIVPDGVLRLLTEERIRQQGEVWVIHKNDADPFPSDPHAHNYQSGHTLHLGNGDLYLRREKVGKVRRKNLMQLRDRIKSILLPPLEV